MKYLGFYETMNVKAKIKDIREHYIACNICMSILLFTRTFRLKSFSLLIDGRIILTDYTHVLYNIPLTTLFDNHLMTNQ